MKTILEYLERTALRVPDRVAFCDETDSLTYGELMRRAKAMGSFLAGRVSKGGVIAMLMDGHSLMSIPAMLGVLYAGCAYSPLDPAMPAERLHLTLDQMKPDCVLVDEKGRKAVSGLEAQLPPIVDCLEAETGKGAALEPIRQKSASSDSMSVLYTSGSTGIPKGSVQSHESYIRFVEATNRVYGFDETVVFGSQSPFFYANSIIDIYPPIALGAKVCLLPPGCLAFPKRFADFMRSQRISELTMTPSSFIALADSLPPGSLPDLRYGIMSGEMMPWRPLSKWMEAAPNADFYNFYGSTEAFSVAVGKVTGEHAPGEVLPVGRPFREVSILFLDENGQEADPGAGGEMLVSNPWLSDGYLHDPSRTEAAFLVDPLHRGVSGRFYRTGDLGRLNEKGELLVLGRRDAQIKHHGYRMEIGEVEAALRSLPGWVDGCVLYDQASDRLFCFWTGELTEKALRMGLRAKLPRAMLPDCFVQLDALPHMATGKLDRTALRRAYMR